MIIIIAKKKQLRDDAEFELHVASGTLAFPFGERYKTKLFRGNYSDVT